MHKMGPWGPKDYILGNQSKNARKIRFHVFLNFHGRKWRCLHPQTSARYIYLVPEYFLGLSMITKVGNQNI